MSHSIYFVSLLKRLTFSGANPENASGFLGGSISISKSLNTSAALNLDSFGEWKLKLSAVTIGVLCKSSYSAMTKDAKLRYSYFM